MRLIAIAAWALLGALLGAAACAPDPQGWALEPQASGSEDYFGHLEHEKIMDEIALIRREIGALRGELAAMRAAADEVAEADEAVCGPVALLDVARLYGGAAAAATMAAYLTGTPPAFMGAEGYLSPSIREGLDLDGFWR